MTENNKQNEPEPRDIRGDGCLFVLHAIVYAFIGVLVGWAFLFIYAAIWPDYNNGFSYGFWPFFESYVGLLMYYGTALLASTVGGVIGGFIGISIYDGDRHALIGAGLGGLIAPLLLFAYVWLASNS